jgi:hypothetical protein
MLGIVTSMRCVNNAVDVHETNKKVYSEQSTVGNSSTGLQMASTASLKGSLNCAFEEAPLVRIGGFSSYSSNRKPSPTLSPIY